MGVGVRVGVGVGVIDGTTVGLTVGVEVAGNCGEEQAAKKINNKEKDIFHKPISKTES